MLQKTAIVCFQMGNFLNSFKLCFLVGLSWRLHFEFVTSTNKDLILPPLQQTEWQAPSEVTVETMVWSLPIKLYSTTPNQVAQGVITNTENKIVIR